MGAAGPAGSDCRVNCVQPFPRTLLGLKQIRKEGDELLARSEILSCWASAFATEASCTASSLVPGRRGGTEGPALPDAPFSEAPRLLRGSEV